MNNAQKIILKNIEQYLTKYPGIRFGQALVNLNILSDNMFYDSDEEIVRKMEWQ